MIETATSDDFEARRDNAVSIALFTSDMMQPAQRLYRTLGFREDLELPRRYGVRYVRFVLPLRGDQLMTTPVETSTPPNTPAPIGPYNHIAKVGRHIAIGGTAGIDPATGRIAGPDVYAQVRRILESFRVMLRSVGSDLDCIMHVNVFLRDIRDFDEMNRAYVDMMGNHRPARTVIGVNDLPKPDLKVTMNLTAVTRD